MQRPKNLQCNLFGLTWADSDVAELGLPCGAAAGLSSVLGLLACAGAVTVTTAACG